MGSAACQRRGITALFMAAFVAGACGSADVASLAGPGVPLPLAEHRAATISDVRYDVRLRIPASRAEFIAGATTITFDLAAAGDVAIDFAQPATSVLRVTANGRDVDAALADEHILVADLPEGVNSVDVEFIAGDGSLNRNDDFLYTLFVPDRARVAMPVFDQPDLKARISWTLEVPADWEAVANGEIVERVTDGDRATFAFRQSDPIASYVFAFAAGRFDVVTAERDGRTFRFLHRETDADSLARNLDAIFDLHAAALAWLEDYTGIAYPFQKFDFVAIPAFQYGGMEHPGAIFYRDRSFFLDEPATQAQLLGRASLIAHETAHMWFGNLVTMRWFNDVWMKEVFANFMAAKIVNPSFPEVDHELRFLLAHYPSAYAVDRSEGANAIRQHLDNLNEAGSLYGAIIYQKAPVVMRHLELLLGEESFRDGLREYLDGHRYGNATWPDLIEVMDQRTDEDLAAWSQVWVNEPGRPAISARLETVTAPDAVDGSTAVVSLHLTQRDSADRGRLWNQRLEVLFGYEDGSVRTFPAHLREASADVAGVAGGAVPEFVLVNGAGVGYGDFELDDRSRDWLLGNLPAVPSARVRAVAWMSLQDGMLNGRVPPPALIDLAMRSLPAEQEELNIQRLVGSLQEAYWGYLTAQQRAAMAAGIEDLLWALMLDAPEPRTRAVLLSGYRGVALTATAIDRLRALWQGELAIDGVPLSENDLTAIAEGLALRGVADAESILDAQRERILNVDRQARFDFVRPALSADPAIRDALFASFADAANREREPWVLSALGYLNHPLRAPGSEATIRPGLELLPEIQRTGDIFFPLGWASSLLDGHASVSAARTVREYLEAHPDLPPRLRGKVLQAADQLFRASRIIEEGSQP